MSFVKASANAPLGHAVHFGMLLTGSHIFTFAGSAGSGHWVEMHSTHWLNRPSDARAVKVASLTVYSSTSVWVSQLSTENEYMSRTVAPIVFNRRRNAEAPSNCLDRLVVVSHSARKVSLRVFPGPVSCVPRKPEMMRQIIIENKTQNKTIIWTSRSRPGDTANPYSGHG